MRPLMRLSSPGAKAGRGGALCPGPLRRLRRGGNAGGPGATGGRARRARSKTRPRVARRGCRDGRARVPLGQCRRWQRLGRRPRRRAEPLAGRIRPGGRRRRLLGHHGRVPPRVRRRVLDDDAARVVQVRQFAEPSTISPADAIAACGLGLLPPLPRAAVLAVSRRTA